MTTRYALPPTVLFEIVRTLRVDHLNAVANHPEVRPWLGGDGPLDLRPVIEQPANLAFETAHGGFVCVALGDGRYEVHSLFTREGHGGEAIAAMRAGCDYVFAATDAVELVTKVPLANRRATGLARLAGFQHAFEARIPWSNHEHVRTAFLTLSIDRWAARSHDALAHGDWLHTIFDAAKAETAAPIPEHSPEEPVHLQMVGAAVLCARVGNVPKGVTLYNRWARFTGYPPAMLLRQQPDVIDLGDGFVVEVRGAELELLRCPRD